MNDEELLSGIDPEQTSYSTEDEAAAEAAAEAGAEGELAWYVVHTYSGYEKKVAEDIKKTIVNRRLAERIVDVLVPEDKEYEDRGGKRHVVEHKIFPGYVLVHMYMDSDTWYVVRNTRGVTGFVGPGSKPVALTKEEVAKLRPYMPNHEEEAEPKTVYACDFEVGDIVIIKTGVYAGSEVTVSKINLNKGRVTVTINAFGGTPLELDISDVKKMS